MFPCLENATFIECNLLSPLSQADRPGSVEELWRNCPLSLKRIQMNLNYEDIFWAIVPQLLEGLHCRFQGKPHGFGRLQVLAIAHGPHPLPSECSYNLHWMVGAEAASRLELSFQQ